MYAIVCPSVVNAALIHRLHTLDCSKTTVKVETVTGHLDEDGSEEKDPIGCGMMTDDGEVIKSIKLSPVSDITVYRVSIHKPGSEKG